MFNLLGHKCREDWPSKNFERCYNLLLDVLLLVLPLAVLVTTYLLIVRTLWRGIKNQPSITTKAQGLLRHIIIIS